MANGSVPSILPIQATGTQHLIDRTYRESGAHQWAREALQNAIEAEATEVLFGIEWQAVESEGVYRRLIADDGLGMTADELVGFFRTFGGGGKPIGGVHENFGVGAKTSLLPWNRYGMVVISWVDGEASMIWLYQDPVTEEYGLKLEQVEDPETGTESWEPVYVPYEDDVHGLNWAAVKPDWIDEHGTVIVLLGNETSADTVLGDPNRSEADIKGLSSYLNRRFWELPDRRVRVDELRVQDRGQWPRSETVAHSPSGDGPDRRTNTRRIEGARQYIEYPVASFKAGKLAASDTETLSDGTKVHWYLWNGPRPAVQSYAAIAGYIGALYKNELYDVTPHHSTYRSFGVTEGKVRSNLWLIIEPPAWDDSVRHGVYPRTDRNALLLRGGPEAGGPLPINEWAGEFSEHMPDEILDAIKAARAGGDGTVRDTAWRERLADRFGSRWKINKLRARRGGKLRLDPTQPGTDSRRQGVKRRKRTRVPATAPGGTAGDTNTGSNIGDKQAVAVKVAGGIPHYRAVQADEVGVGMLAGWSPNDPEHSEGVVLLNVEHPVMVEEITHWQAQYPDHYADEIADDVIDVYGQLAVAKVAHSEHLKGVMPSTTVEDELRSEAALTMSLLGLMAEEAILATRIGGKYRKRKGV